MKSFIEYLKNVRGELTHVVWPKPKTAVAHTLIIIVLSAATAIIIAALDYVFTSGVNVLISQ